MTLKHALLGLLVKEAKHGYELQTDFHQVVGNLWDLNISQIYNTLNRLEKDNYVVGRRVEQAARPSKNVYTITEKGRREFIDWLETPAKQPWRLKHEFFLKLNLCLSSNFFNPQELLRRQRQAYLQAIHDLNKLKKETKDRFDLLLVKSALLHLEADMKWLDECEEVISLPKKREEK